MPVNQDRKTFGFEPLESRCLLAANSLLNITYSSILKPKMNQTIIGNHSPVVGSTTLNIGSSNDTFAGTISATTNGVFQLKGGNISTTGGCINTNGNINTIGGSNTLTNVGTGGCVVLSGSGTITIGAG